MLMVVMLVLVLMRSFSELALEQFERIALGLLGGDAGAPGGALESNLGDAVGAGDGHRVHTSTFITH